jgi:integrase
MSVYTRVDETGKKTYWFRVWIEGREFRRSTRQGDKREAQRLEAEFRTNYSKGGLREADPRCVETLKAFVPVFLDYCKTRRKVRQSTYESYDGLLTNLAESKSLGSMPLSKIDDAAFSDYCEERRKTGKAEKDPILRLERTILMALLKYACSRKLIQFVPVILSTELGKQRRREYVPDAETFGKYLQNANPTLRDAAILCASTGLRPGEILSLTPSQIAETDDGYVITLDEAKSEMGMKPIYVSPTNAKAACAVIASRIGKALLFDEVHGEDKEARVHRLGRMHRDLRVAIGLPPQFTFYAFRHLYITMAGLTLTPQHLRELARHQNIDTTMAYYFNPPEAERKRVASSVRLLQPASSPAESLQGSPTHEALSSPDPGRSSGVA